MLCTNDLMTSDTIKCPCAGQLLGSTCCLFELVHNIYEDTRDFESLRAARPLVMTCPTLSYVLVSFLAVLNLVDSRTVSHSRGTQPSAGTGEFGQHVVDIGYAKYLGNYSAPYSLAFLGLPYAEPPVGNLRFRRPEPLDTEVLSRAGGVINAQSYPNFCVQGSTGQGDAGGAGTEDCLKVNVYTPVNATSESKCECSQGLRRYVGSKSFLLRSASSVLYPWWGYVQFYRLFYHLTECNYTRVRVWQSR